MKTAKSGHSIQAALQILTKGKMYHMAEVVRNGEEDAAFLLRALDGK